MMIEEVKQYEESYNQIHQKYPNSFRDFSDKKLKEFDENQTGTIKELTEEREKFRTQLQVEYKELKKKQHEEYNAVENEFREKIYQESYAKNFPNGRKIFDRLFSIAYDRGHSCGMQEVISRFDEIDDKFHELMEIMNENRK